jgi:hypothetical protein
MKFLIILFILFKFIHSESTSGVIKHPFIHIGDFEVNNETLRKYFYSDDVHASWAKSVELCELFEMKIVTFKNAEEDKKFRESFASFFDGRPYFIFVGANTTRPGSKNDWKWINGEKINFDITWGENQPNNEENKEFCLCMDEADPLVYHDISCTEKYPFVCEENWIYERILVKKN